jgi:hypothetical protein
MKKLWYWSNPDEGGYYITDPAHTPLSSKYFHVEFVSEITDQQAHLLLALAPNCVSEDKDVPS